MLNRANGVRFSQHDGPAQNEMARAITDATNAVMHHHGCCRDSLPAPGKLPPPARSKGAARLRLCDVENLAWPRGMKPQVLFDRVSKGSRHGVRVCQFNPRTWR
ncbi:hypothetical protein [Streptomyces sp. 3N207]|uniref:hypothetical protein n=1 Tax=Streptomyces sp. 3N207 TaxID=3457417 RepID=UPI003FD06EE3